MTLEEVLAEFIPLSQRIDLATEGYSAAIVVGGLANALLALLTDPDSPPRTKAMDAAVQPLTDIVRELVSVLKFDDGSVAESLGKHRAQARPS